MMTIEDVIENASIFGQNLQDLVALRGQVTLGERGQREKLLLAFWALVFDLDRGMLTLMRCKSYSGAFALLRSIVEAMLRASVVVTGSDADVNRIVKDKYRVNYATIASQLDTALQWDGLLDFVPNARNNLHSFTHAGRLQIDRWIKENVLEPNYKPEEILGVIYMGCVAIFIVTFLVTKQFDWQDEATESERLVRELKFDADDRRPRPERTEPSQK
jgi:hypothetical protein